MERVLLILLFGITVSGFVLTFTFAEGEISNPNPISGLQTIVIKPLPVNPNDWQKPYDVIVVGAGMAGLEAAHKLQHRGITNVIVLEAADRIGGRTWTVNADGLSLDLGGSWIHGGINNNYTFPNVPNPIYKIAEDYNIKVNQTDSNYNASLYTSAGQKLNLKDVVESPDFENFLSWEKPKLQSKSSLQDVMDAYYYNMGYPKQSLDWLKYYYFMYWDFVFDQGDEASKISSADLFPVKNNLADIFYFNGETFNETIIPDGGYAQIYNKLADGLDIKHENVTKIDYSDNIVKVTTADGRTFHAKYVLSTLPLGVLKSGKVEFVPPLDQNKMHAIKNLGMNVMDKAYFIFNTSSFFWKNDMDKDWINRFPDNATDTGWLWFFNIYKYTEKYVPDKPVLLAFNTGDFARKLENENDDQIRKDGLSVLSQMYNNDTIKNLTPDIVVTRHYKDPTRYGSYSYLGKNATLKDYDYLAEPVNNRLFFAGEATNKYYLGTVHGAYISGFRAAEQILKLEEKLYPPLQQLENGIKPWDVSCNAGLVLMNRTNGEAVCIENSQTEKERLSVTPMSIPSLWK